MASSFVYTKAFVGQVADLGAPRLLHSCPWVQGTVVSTRSPSLLVVDDGTGTMCVDCSHLAKTNHRVAALMEAPVGQEVNVMGKARLEEDGSGVRLLAHNVVSVPASHEALWTLQLLHLAQSGVLDDSELVLD